MNNEIRLVKKEQEQINTNTKDISTFKRKENIITANSPIIKRLKEAEEKNRNRKKMSDDELIELEFKEEADKIRSQNTQENNKIIIKSTQIKDENFNLDYIKDNYESSMLENFKEKNLEPKINFNKNIDTIEHTKEHLAPIERVPLHHNSQSVDFITSKPQNMNIIQNLESKPKDNQDKNYNLIDNKNFSTSDSYSIKNYSKENNNLEEQPRINEINKINEAKLPEVNLITKSEKINENIFKESIRESLPPQNEVLINHNIDIVKNQDDNNFIQNSCEFILPPTDLLNNSIHKKVDVDLSEIDLKANNLINKLRVFKINGDIADIYSGPVVTTFEFRPAPDVKVSRIQNLQDDLSMALKAKSIRIQAPIPGKDVVGIEIPNNIIQTIYLREIFESDEFIKSSANLAITLGKDIIGNPVIEDLAKLPHLLIAGTTGSGKSVGLNGMILSLLYKNTPKDLRFIMIDPKRVELSLYKDIPHLLTPIIADPKKAVIALSKAVDEMNKRYEVMNSFGVKNIIGYNEIAKEQGLEKLPYIVIIIDEFADLMIMGGKDAEQYLISLASKARASGIHLIIATQRPTVNVVTGLIKSNLPSKISYRVGTQMDSKVILDKVGAESLLGNGDMLFSNTNSIIRYHAPYSHEKEIEKVANFIRAQQTVEYDEFFSLEPKETTQTSTNIIPSTEEEYLQKAREIILQTQKTSISYLQRALGIGFNKAAGIIESLEKDGFLSPPNSKGLREILNQ